MVSLEAVKTIVLNTKANTRTYISILLFSVCGLLTVGISTPLHAQSISTQGLLEWADAYYANGSGILRGTVYKPRFIGSSNPFLEDEFYFDATIYYFGEPYFHQKTSIDISEHAITVKKRIGTKEIYIRVFEEAIDSILIGKRKFIVGFSDERRTIYEELFAINDMKLLHRQDKKEHVNRLNRLEYKSTPNMVLQLGSSYTLLKSFKTYQHTLPYHKSEINKFIKTNDLQYDNLDDHMQLLMYMATLR